MAATFARFGAVVGGASSLVLCLVCGALLVLDHRERARALGAVLLVLGALGISSVFGMLAGALAGALVGWARSGARAPLLDEGGAV